MGVSFFVLWILWSFIDDSTTFLSDQLTNLINGKQNQRYDKINDEDCVFTKSPSLPPPEQGCICVLSDPSGANVFLGNRFEGRAPITFSNMNVGNYTIKAWLSGAPLQERLVTLSGGETKVLRFKFDGGPRSSDEWVEPITDMAFIWIPKGCFWMGQTEDEKRQLIREFGEEYYENNFSDELPRHEVCVDGFWMGKYEVTYAQFRDFCSKYEIVVYKGNPLQGYDHPVVNVSWNDVKAFIEWLNSKGFGTFGLPTEAEWEYACRGGKESIRYWGDSPENTCLYANVYDATSKSEFENFTWMNHPCTDGYAVVAPVGSFRANGFGLYDMLGNVWEWCEDKFASDAYIKHSRNNPMYPSNSSYRVLRGGSWYDEPSSVRCASRLGYAPGDSLGNLGFRLTWKP